MNQTFIQKVAKIQKELKAPKSQRNTFGKYNYRNCEDILEAVKPLLGDLILTVNDEIVEVGGRVYVKSTSTITDGDKSVSNTAYAREPQEQKGMSDGQLTGATSSYARKYSLNGLFLIDDTKDADTEEYQGKKPESIPAETVKSVPVITSNPPQVETVTQGTPVAKTGWASKAKKTEPKPQNADEGY